VHACLHGNSASAAGMSIVLLGLNCKISSTFSTITISSVDQLPSIMSSAQLNCKKIPAPLAPSPSPLRINRHPS
jgi:hypothetical protein